jgi:hypothetical protein
VVAVPGARRGRRGGVVVGARRGRRGGVVVVGGEAEALLEQKTSK